MYTVHSPRQHRRTLYRLLVVLWTLIIWNAVTAEHGDAFFIVSTVDGSIGVLKAFDGSLVGGFRSGTPLVGPSEILSGGRRIVPGLDGQLYISLEHQEGLLHPLEITILDVLQTPVKTCKEQNCGIVTATKSTSLFALDARSGRLVWKQSSNGTTIIEDDLNEKEDEQDDSITSTVLLQREDVLVQQLSTDSGKSVWNVTLGTVQALEFGEGGGASDALPMGGAYLPSGDSRQLMMQGYYRQVELPSVIFGPDGTSLTAVSLTQTEEVRILWKRDFPTVVASVFGLQDKTWKPLTVLDDTDSNRTSENGDKLQLNAAQPTSRSVLTVYQPPVLQRLFSPWTKPMPFLERLFQDWFFATGHTRRRHSPSLSRFWPAMNLHQVAVPKKHTMTPLYEQHDLFMSPRHTLALPSPTFDDYNSRHGVFLTWPFLVAICIMVIGLAALVFRYLYLQKKTKWILLLQHFARGENYIAEETSDVNLTTVPTLKRSHSLPDVGCAIQPFPRRHRSESLQISHTADGRLVYDKELDDEKEASTTATSTSNIRSQPQEPQTQGVGFLVDGIPLIRYNRYDSEFSEVVALGKGGFGTVFRCKNVLDGREYAIKKVSLKYKEGLPLEEFRQRLQRTLREVKSLALLDHPNIVRYYTAWLELQQHEDQEERRQSSQHLADSDYYLFSPTTNTKTYKSRSASETACHPRSSLDDRNDRQNCYHHTANPLGSWSGLNDGTTTNNEPSFQPFYPGVPTHLEDYGFTFDRDEDEENDGSATTESNKEKHAVDEKSKSLAFLPEGPTVHRYCSNHSSSGAESSIEGSTTHGWSRESRNQENRNGSMTENSTEERDLQQTKTPAIMVKHILYIQMQFCSQKTLADFLSNAEARKGGESKNGHVDIPYALSLFLQIAQGVQHVHSQGLIHRDLKPNNCFIDDSGAVKVGDFGLSRESSNENREGLETVQEVADDVEPSFPTFREITAGVGTRSYASPEQMQGSDYDSSTDIYSLGILLFELCYPMYTGMERTIVLSKLRNHIFPDQWIENVRPAFPTLHTLLQSMISNNPADRPNAVTVVRSIEAILEGFTISSIDKQHHENAILLRVEAKPREDVLRHTMKLVEDAASPDTIDIVQYGLRGGTNSAVMEFAISSSTCQDTTVLGNTLVDRLDKCDEVLLIRQVSGTKYTYCR